MAKDEKSKGVWGSRFGWEFFGAELKRAREASGLTQQELGDKVFCSGSYIGQFEAMIRKPQLDVAQRIDGVLGTDGFFGRMCEKLIDNSPFADYFKYPAELEALATSITEYAPQLVPGVLQLPEYSREVFRSAQPLRTKEEVDSLVDLRLGRRHILHRSSAEKKLLFWAILDEAVLRRPVGGTAVMAEQLEHLAQMIREDRVFIQIMPFSAGAHALMEGFTQILTFDDAPPVAYVEGPQAGQLMDDPATVARCVLAYDVVRADALSRAASLALIERTVKEYQGDTST
jgi:transcriptional regulator with XRE-family HTH domain